MLDPFLSFVKKNKLFLPKDRILLAVSGGLDSVVMAELFHKARFNFAIAHCNFQLRGRESDGDAQFVKKLAERYRVKFFSRHFDTDAEAQSKKISIQMAARDLRYAWFESITRKEKYKYVATAHHLNDSIETLFINMLRGTGIEGITGIEIKNKHVIRPMLFATRVEIERFAKQNKIEYREDSSNQSDDYLRNKIRHHIIPAFKMLNPKFEERMAGNMSHFAFAAKIFRQQLQDRSAALLKKEKELYHLSLKELKKQEDADQLLYEILSPFGFNYTQCLEMLNSGSATQSGKMFSSGHFKAIRDREKLLIDAVRYSDDQQAFKLTRSTKKTATHIFSLFTSFSEKKNKAAFPPDAVEQWLDAGLLRFPLTLRPWKKGDFFYPLGMKHHKKISDFLIDKKVSLPGKENTYVLVSANKIVCILGHRIDDRFKVTEQTKKIYKVKLKYL